jgi:ABC-type Zn2+ transport system substrate-binding protein/surface adhesin
VSTAAIRFTMCLSQAAGIQSVSLSLRVALVTNLDLRAVGRCVRDTDRHTDRRRHTHTHTHTRTHTHTHTHTHTIAVQVVVNITNAGATAAVRATVVRPGDASPTPLTTVARDGNNLIITTTLARGAAVMRVEL